MDVRDAPQKLSPPLRWPAMKPDHYEVLGVDAGAGHNDIRAAYRRLMRTHHPDLRPGDRDAEEQARRITAAWAVLGRPSTRAAYDRQRSASRTPVTASRPHPPAQPAYSPDGSAYRRAFHVASLKIAAVVMSVGVIALVVFSR